MRLERQGWFQERELINSDNRLQGMEIRPLAGWRWLLYESALWRCSTGVGNPINQVNERLERKWRHKLLSQEAGHEREGKGVYSWRWRISCFYEEERVG